jgi:imidazolonepropionase-like amidohydrolase
MFIAVRGDWLIDGTGMPPLKDGLVLVQDDKITAVGRADEISLPEETHVLSLKGQTILPGLIEVHGHLGLDRRLGNVAAQIQDAVPIRALRAASLLRQNLRAGITTMRLVGDTTGVVDFACRQAVAQGLLPGPRLLVSGRPIASTYWYGVGKGIDGPEEVCQAVRAATKAETDVIKLMATSGLANPVLPPTVATYSEEEIAVAVAEAQRARKRIAVHAHGGPMLRHCAELGVDTIEHGAFADDDDIETLARTGTWLVCTLGILYHPQYGLEPAFRERGEGEKLLLLRQQVRATLSRAFEAGVKYTVGTDGLHLVAYELECLVDLGLSPMEAIVAATGSAAQACGLADHTGTLKPGKWADLIAVPGNPLQDITTLNRVTLVMKEGQRYDTLSWD